MPLHLSWTAVQRTIQLATPQLEAWHPTALVAISGGGSIPARILRTCLKHRTGLTLPMQTIGLVLYDDDHFKSHPSCQKSQWLDAGFDVQGQRILLVDEVDDSRRTLAYAVSEMQSHFAAAEARYNAARRAGDPEWVAPQLGIFVVHNKRRPKAAQLPAELMATSYFVGGETEDMWHVYPWDAVDIDAHSAMAQAQALAASQALAHKPLTYQESVAQQYCSAYRTACVDCSAAPHLPAPLLNDEAGSAAKKAKLVVVPMLVTPAVAAAAVSSNGPAVQAPVAVAQRQPSMTYESHIQAEYMAALRGACLDAEISAPRGMKRVMSGCGLAAAAAAAGGSPLALAGSVLLM